ncbi:hypothetical protein GCM10011316_11740 [Roseibium aquae]|uniref:Solute-binding protein family 3/N-terminal domain-containing protein n=1 Tax=Roseibium aquae TaxID=1323746 RepID=A0A916TEZ7_9HYPH|nr:transporter substrate-binding domain-containing protein [Roseibium aquae]GGB41443.1 hypothetical protein GCM10011316_11740 [Roseibium aquae]
MPFKTHIRTTGFAITLALACFGSAQANELVIAADPWCPFNCEPGSDKPGYMVEIAREVFEPLGYTVTYEQVNWARALVETREGKYAAVFGASIGDADDFVFPKEAQGKAGNAIFVAAGSDWSFSKPEDLSGKTIGLIRDYDYGDLGTQIETHGEASFAGGDDALETNIKKLLAGRLDALVEEASVFNYSADQMGVSDQVRLEGESEYDPVYIAFSPARPESGKLAEELDAGMKALRSSGKLGEILSKYGLKDWSSGS